MDTMVMASLIDENRFRYDLNSISFDYTGERKSEAALYEAAKDWGVDPKAELYKLRAMHVGTYAEKDAELTLELFKRLSTEIKREKLEEIFNLETQLFPCLVDMRFLGVRVDVEGAHKLKQQLIGQEKECLQIVKKETGIDVQIWAARSIQQVFEKLWQLILLPIFEYLIVFLFLFLVIIALLVQLAWFSICALLPHQREHL